MIVDWDAEGDFSQRGICFITLALLGESQSNPRRNTYHRFLCRGASDRIGQSDQLFDRMNEIECRRLSDAVIFAESRTNTAFSGSLKADFQSFTEMPLISAPASSR